MLTQVPTKFGNWQIKGCEMDFLTTEYPRAFIKLMDLDDFANLILETDFF